MLEKGDIDITRKRAPKRSIAWKSNADIAFRKAPRARFTTSASIRSDAGQAGSGRGDEVSGRLPGDCRAPSCAARSKVHENACRRFPRGAERRSYSLDVAKAKELLAKAGLPDGFTVTMDTRNTPEITGMAQAMGTMAQAGIEIEIVPGNGSGPS